MVATYHPFLIPKPPEEVGNTGPHLPWDPEPGPVWTKPTVLCP